MSHFSGFASQTQEAQYNKLVEAFLKLVLKRLNKFYLQQESDELAFKSLFSQIVYNLKVSLKSARSWSATSRRVLSTPSSPWNWPKPSRYKVPKARPIKSQSPCEVPINQTSTLKTNLRKNSIDFIRRILLVKSNTN